MKTYKLNNVEVSKQELQELIKNNPELSEDLTESVFRGLNDKNWRAGFKNSVIYYSVEGCSASAFYDTRDNMDNSRFNTLNYFKIREQAEAYSDYLLAVGRVSRAIWKANGDWKADWNDSRDVKYSIFYDHTNKKILWAINEEWQFLIILPYIKSSEIAEQIIKDYREDLLTIFNYKR